MEKVTGTALNTLFERARAEPEPTGRFAAITSPPLFSGVPRLPEASPWFSYPVPQEPPLGIDVNSVPYCSGEGGKDG
jgi:hypothetical protein